MLFLFIRKEFDRTIEVDAVEGGVGFVGVGELEEVGEFALTLALLQAGVDFIYSNLLLDLVLRPA